MGQQGSRTRVWAPKGTRPRVVKQQQFLCQYIFGAVCSSQKSCAAIIVPCANHQALEKHLELADPPRRIEGFDISHFQGGETVASMVVYDTQKGSSLGQFFERARSYEALLEAIKSTRMKATPL